MTLKKLKQKLSQLRRNNLNKENETFITKPNINDWNNILE
jgi:hypothetical protein